MKRPYSNAISTIQNEFGQHKLFQLIKKTEIAWSDTVAHYRLSAEEVFVEVMWLIDELKQEGLDVDWKELYKRLQIEYRQKAIDSTDAEITWIVSIIVSTLFSILGDSYRDIAEDLAAQCAQNDSGFSSRLAKIFIVFDSNYSCVENWLNYEYLQTGNQELVSKRLQTIIYGSDEEIIEAEKKKKLEEFSEYFTIAYKRQHALYSCMIDRITREDKNVKNYARYAKILYDSNVLVPNVKPKRYEEWYKICCDLLGWHYVESYTSYKVRDCYTNETTKELLTFLAYN